MLGTRTLKFGGFTGLIRVLLFLLLVSSGFSTTTYLQAHNKTMSSGGSYPDKAGFNITMKGDYVLTKVQLYYGCTATTAYLYTNDGVTQLANATFSGLDATFNYTLSNATSYRILVDKTGSNYVVQQTLAGGFPVSDSIITWKNGIYAGANYTSGYNIMNLTFQSLPSPISFADINETITRSGSSINLTGINLNISDSSGYITSANVTITRPDMVVFSTMSLSNTSATDWNWTGTLNMNMTGTWTINISAIDNNSNTNYELSYLYIKNLLYLSPPTNPNGSKIFTNPAILNMTSDIPLPINYTFFYMQYYSLDYHSLGYVANYRNLTSNAKCTMAPNNLSCYYIVPHNESYTAYTYNITGFANNLSTTTNATWSYNYSGCGILMGIDYQLEADMNGTGDCFDVDAASTFECSDHRVTGNGSGTGVRMISGAESIVDCIISNFTYGVNATLGLYTVNVGYVIRNTIFNNTYGLYVHDAAKDCQLFSLSSPMGCIYNNTIYNNTYGMFVTNMSSPSAYPQIFNNTVFNSTNEGLALLNPIGLVLLNNSLYGNNPDFRAEATTTGKGYSALNTTFLDVKGNYGNHTWIHLLDSLASGDNYSISWSASPASPPSGYGPFLDKYVTSSTDGGSPALNATWIWTDAELAGYNESNIALWEHTSNWTKMNGTLNTTSNTYAISDISPAGVYALMEGTSPPAITSMILSPANLYKNSTAYCAVNWTYSNVTFTVHSGLTINGTRVDVFNTTNTSYSNNTMWNTSFSLVNYTHFDKVACWSFATYGNSTSDLNLSANITMGNYAPNTDNITISYPLINGSNAVGSSDVWDLEGDTPINCSFYWYVNNVSVYNNSQAPCTGTSTLGSGNYTVGDVVHFNISARDMYNVSANLTSGYSVVSPDFAVNNYTFSSTQYETVRYNYTINFTIPLASNLTSAVFHIHGMDISSTCSNVSSVYYCYSNNIPAPLTETNGTPQTAYWLMNYTNGSGYVEQNQSFNVNVYFGMWPAGYINSPTLAIGGTYVVVNFTYGTASGAQGNVTGVGKLGNGTATATCASGLCNASILTSSVSTISMHQTFANLTFTSPYWGESITRGVWINASLLATALNFTYSYSAGITNPLNANDTSWSTAATLPSSPLSMTFNLSLQDRLYQLNEFVARDGGGYHNYAIPQDCWRQNISIQVARIGTQFNYSCLNYSSGVYSQFGLNTPGVYTFYEANLTYYLNNSFTRLLPFGFTDCTTGTPIIHYECFDETTSGSLTCDYEQTFQLETISGDLIQTFTGAGAASWDICFYPDTLSGNFSSTEEISGAGYDTRFYYIFSAPFSSSYLYNESRFIGPSATTKLTFVYVKRAGVGVENVYVYVQRLFIANNTFQTVGMGRTNDVGSSVVYLEPNDAFYRFTVVDASGTVLYTSTTQQVGCDASSASCSVTLNIESSVVDFWDYQDGIASNCTFDNSTKIVACSFVVADGTSHEFVLEVYRWEQYGNKTLNCTKNVTTSAGALYCDMGDDTTTGQFVWYLKSFSNGLVLQEGAINWAALASWGSIGVFIAFCIIMVLGFIGTRFGPSMTMILAYAGLVASTWLQFVHLDLAGLVGIGIVAGVLVYVIKA